MSTHGAMRFRGVAAAALAANLIACGGPLLVFPGGRLSGEVVDPPNDFSFADDTFIDLETRPGDPYSVELNYVVKNGRLYIDPAEGRAWLDHIREDQNVRVRIHDKVYPLRAVLVEDPAELEGFDESRVIYRLDPR